MRTAVVAVYSLLETVKKWGMKIKYKHNVSPKRNKTLHIFGSLKAVIFL